MGSKRRLVRDESRAAASTLRCETCGSAVADELALLKHRESAHLQRACAYCPARFGTIEDLMGHYKVGHPDGDPKKGKKKLVLTSSHCKFCSQMHDSRTMYKFDWERREIVKCRCCDSCDRDRRLVERNPGPSGEGSSGINWNRQEAGVKYKCFLCEVSFDHPLVARSHFTRCHGFPKDIELVAHSTDADAAQSVEVGAEEDDDSEEIAVTEEDEVAALQLQDAAGNAEPPSKVFASDYRNSLFVSGNSRPRRSAQMVEYEIREPGSAVRLPERDDSHRYDFEEDGQEFHIQLVPQEYAEEVTVVADF